MKRTQPAKPVAIRDGLSTYRLRPSEHFGTRPAWVRYAASLERENRRLRIQATGDDGTGKCYGCGVFLDRFNEDCDVCMAVLLLQTETA